MHTRNTIPKGCCHSYGPSRETYNWFAVYFQKLCPKELARYLRGLTFPTQSVHKICRGLLTCMSEGNWKNRSRQANETSAPCREIHISCTLAPLVTFSPLSTACQSQSLPNKNTWIRLCSKQGALAMTMATAMRKSKTISLHVQHTLLNTILCRHSMTTT